MKRNTILLIAIAGLALMLVVGTVSVLASAGPIDDDASIHYVAPNADCGEVSPCYASVQAAVDVAVDGDIVKVSSGVYTDVHFRAGMTQTVYVSKSITLRGGYTTTNWTTPDPEANPVTLDARGQGRVFHITGEISPTLEGFRITGGSANPDGYYIRPGAGIYIHDVRHVVISNTAVYSNFDEIAYGGGITLRSSNAEMHNVDVCSNTAHYGGGIRIDGGHVVIEDANVSNNYAGGHQGRGGGIDISSSEVVIARSQIRGNSSSHPSHPSAGIRANGAIITMSNTILARNPNEAIRAYDNSAIALYHCVIDNHPMYAVSVYNSELIGANNIIANHLTGIVGTGVVSLTGTLWHSNSNDWSSAVEITHTRDVWGDPMFVDAGNGDYHIAYASAAIDAGVDAGVDRDVDNDPRPQGDGFDIGVDEALIVAPGDANGDGVVDAGDITALVLEIFDGDGDDPADTPGGDFPGTLACDANEDGIVNADDLSCTILLIFNGPGACDG